MAKSENHLTLCFPGLLASQRVQEGLAQLKKTELVKLQTLLSKADYHFPKKRCHEDLTAYLFHQQKAPSSAITRANGLCDLSDDELSEYWVSIDPVQMIPDRDTLILIPSADIGITEEESKALLENFNQHFSQDGLKLIFGDAHQWFLSIKQPVAIETTPLYQVAYQSVNNHYPEGAAGNYWRQLMNETQMLFYNHEVNHQRRLLNLPEINSVWVWGEGGIDLDKINQRNNAVLLSNSDYSKGLAKFSGAEFAATPKSFKACRNQILSSHHTLIEFNDQTFSGVSLEQMTLEQWLDLLCFLEKNWFKPVFESVKNKELDSVLLELGANKQFLITSKTLKRFWRWKKSWLAISN